MDSRKLVEEYIKGIDHLYRTGEATELSYRSCLQQLLEKCTLALARYIYQTHQNSIGAMCL